MSRIFPVLVASLISLPALAADYLGAAGTVDALEVNHTTATTYLQYHGAITVVTVGGPEQYRWGGTSCSNKTLTEGQVTMLQRALESASVVTPRWSPGQGSNRCVVGFLIGAP